MAGPGQVSAYCCEGHIPPAKAGLSLGGRKQPGPPQLLLPSQLLSPGGAWGWLLTPPQLATSVIYAALTLGGHRLHAYLRDGPLPRAFPRPHTASSANTAWDSAVNKGFGSQGSQGPAVCGVIPAHVHPCGARLPFLMGTCVKGANLGEAAILDWALMQEFREALDVHFCLLGCGYGGNLGTVACACALLSPCAPATQAEACCEAALRPPEAAAVPWPGRRLGPAPPDGWVGSGLGCPCNSRPRVRSLLVVKPVPPCPAGRTAWRPGRGAHGHSSVSRLSCVGSNRAGYPAPAGQVATPEMPSLRGSLRGS